MDELFKLLGPASAAVIVTAWLFLRAQRDSNAQWQKTVTELNGQWQSTVTTIAEQAHEDRKESKKVILDNTRALTLVAERMEAVRCLREEDT